MILADMQPLGEFSKVKKMKYKPVWHHPACFSMNINLHCDHYFVIY